MWEDSAGAYGESDQDTVQSMERVKRVGRAWTVWELEGCQCPDGVGRALLPRLTVGKSTGKPLMKFFTDEGVSTWAFSIA